MSNIDFTELPSGIGSILMEALRSNSRRQELVDDVIMPYVAEQIRKAAPWNGFHDVSFVEYYDPTPSPHSLLNTHYIKVSGEDHEGLRLVRTYFDGCGTPDCRQTIQEGQVTAPPELVQWLKEGHELAEGRHTSGKSKEQFYFQSLAQKVIVDKFDEHTELDQYIGNMYKYMDNHFNVSDEMVFVPLRINEHRYPATFRGIVLYSDGDYTDCVQSVVDLRDNMGPVDGLLRLITQHKDR